MRLASAYCSLQAKRHIAVVGLPGTGKWSIGQRLYRQYCWCHIDASKYGSDADSIDDIEKELASYRCSQGAVLTSYPQNASQSQALKEAMSRQGKRIEKVIELQAESKDISAGRVRDRIVHEASGRRYHPFTTPPKVPYKDDYTGEGLVCRLTDSEEGFQTRWSAYNSAAISHHFPLTTVSTVGKSLDEVWHSVESSLL